MESISSTIEGILRLQIDEGASVREGDFGDKLSPFLRGVFDTYDVTVDGERFCVARVDGDSLVDAGVMKKTAALEKAIGLPVVLCLTGMTPSQRRSFIKHRQGFVSMRGDLYLPHMALSLSAFDSENPVIRGKFTPAEQALFLFCLYFEGDTITQSAAMDVLGLSSATVSRALSSLSDRGLVDYRVGGATSRLKEYFVVDKREFYQKGVRLFNSPISQRFMASLCSYDKQLLFSGLSALSALSDLTRPVPEVFAAGKVEARAVRDSETFAMGAERGCMVQVLKYDPRPLARMIWGGMAYVDPVTMLLTIDDEDERISMAVREVMGRFEWYTE